MTGKDMGGEQRIESCGAEADGFGVPRVTSGPDEAGSQHDGGACIAWMGWSLSTPPDWRPLRFSGNWSAGAATIGDGRHAVCRLRWWRPGRRRFDAGRWIQRHHRRTRGLEPLDRARDLTDFTHAAAFRGSDLTESVWRLWCGYSPSAGLVVELAVNAGAPEALREAAWSEVMPTLCVQHSEGAMSLVVFGARFLVDAGYVLKAWRLLLGDIALRVVRAEGYRSLVLRQVYPAALALSRRPFASWLRTRPFSERRRFRADADPSALQLGIGGEREGLCCTGTKRWPFPFGRLAPLRTVGVVTHDTGHDRLYMAECDAAGEEDFETVAAAIRDMGRVNESSVEN